MAAEFKLSRLRYSWQGEWAPSTFYNKDAIVSFQGKTYVCLVPNTSGASFAADLAASPFNYWALVVDGKQWKSAWTPSTLYSPGQIVTFGGQLYICTTSHTSGLSTIDVANWTIYSTSNNWHPAWTPNTVYGVGDVVKYGGIVYKCNANHTSGADYTAGLEANFGSWSVLFSGIDYKGAWSGLSIRYKANDVVKLNAELWICTTPHTSNSTFAGTSWQLYLPGLDVGGTWNPLTTYQPGDSVVYGGFNYVNTALNNLNVIPSSNPASWTLIVQGYEIRQDWSSNSQYKVGDVVNRKGQLFEAITDSGQTPTPGPQDPSVFLSQINYNSTGSSGITVATGGTFTTSYSTASQTLTAVGNVVGYASYLSIPVGAPITGPGIPAGTVVTQVAGGNISISNATTSASGLTLSGVAITGTAGQFSCTATSQTIAIGESVTISGTYGGAGSISGYANPTTYYIIATNGSTTFTLSATPGGAAITTTAGTPTGLTYTITQSVATYGAPYIQPGMIIQGVGFTQGQAVTSINAAGTVIKLNYGPDGTPVNGQTLSFIGINTTYWKLLVPSIQWNNFWTTIVTYSNLSGTNVSGSGAGATFNVTSTGSTYSVTLVTSGAGYTVSDNIKILGSAVGGTDGVNDITIAITGVNYGQAITTFTTTGTSVGKVYVEGDLVLYQNTTYICTQTHTATAGSRPDLDTTGTYWTIDAAHARKNAMTSYGDLETFSSSSNSYAAVPVGAQGTVLRNVNGTPTWSTLHRVTKVYYVSSTTGTDASGYGLDWDKPFKTIKYACTLAGQGTAYPNTISLLTQNKLWLVTEMYYWMLTQKASNLTPFTSSSQFDQTKTLRDAQYIIDALINDLGRGGNSQTVAATLAYFAQESSTTFINATVAAEMPYFIAALTELLSLMTTYVLTNTAETTTFQTVNGVNLNSQVLQVINNSIVPEGDAISAVSTLMSIVINTLTKQNTSYLPTPNSGIATSIFVKTGTYSESLPIVVPENVGIIGDELRGVVVQPATSVNTICTNTTASSNTFTVLSTASMYDNCPVQFASPNIANNVLYTPLGGVTAGMTYYVIGATITPTTFSVSQTPGGTFTASTTTGSPNLSGVSNIGSIAVGSYIVGLGIPAGARVQSTNLSTNSVTLDATATSSYSGVSLTYSGVPLVLTTSNGTIATGSAMAVYGGDAIKNMFLMRNATTLRNMTMVGLLGTLGAMDSYQIQRPTGGAYASLDPGTGPSDTSTWIIRRSPYVQNCTTFGNGCVGMKIDGNLHNGGYKSMVANDFTQILSDGIGVWCTGPGSKTECISVFAYYGYSGYFAEGGGRIRAANGNSSYGQYGAISEGYDSTETPGTGIIFNQSTQVQATVESSFGSVGKILKLLFSNAGANYTTSTTNLLTYSNSLTNAAWVTDGNVTLQQTATAPTGVIEAWTVYGTSGTSSTSYVYQNVAVPAAGGVYTNVAGSNITGSGTSATFDITVSATTFTATVNNPGTGYVVGNQINIPGNLVGGIAGVNDCLLTVSQLSGSAVNQVTASGTVPAGSAIPYTFSIYVNQGSASSIDLYGIWSGSSTATSYVSYNFATGVVTPGNTNGVTPTAYKAQIGTVQGWVRLWFTAYDPTGLNTQIQFRVYPKGYAGASGTYSYVYGAQLELTPPTAVPGFYLETANTKYTAFTNLKITGAGTGVVAVGNETRSGSVFQTRVIADLNSFVGGTGYLTSSNQAQLGDPTYIQLAQSEVNTASNYVTMRVFINSGTGAGQYGYISNYNASTKVASVMRESFKNLPITTTTSSNSTFTIAGGANTNALYAGQPVQFIPTYYQTTITATSLAQVLVTASVGGNTDTLTVSNTNGMYVNMGVTFSGNIFTSVIPGYTYYISAILNSTTIQISSQLYGSAWQLTDATGSMTMSFTSNTGYISAPTSNMVSNYPIQFTGSMIGGLSSGVTYYINDIIDSGTFSISSNLLTATVGTTSSSNNRLTLASGTTSSLQVLNPIIFGVYTAGGINANTKYYISTIPNSSTFTVASSILTPTVTTTTYGTNLITCSSTAGFVVNNPIKFVGTTFGNIVNETVYYILAINDAQTFTISQTPGGAAFTLSNGIGSVSALTCPAPVTLTNATIVVTTTGTGTGAQTTITVASGTGIAAGMSVTGTGIGTGAVVDVSYTPGSTTVPLTVANSGAVSGTIVLSAGNFVGTTTSAKLRPTLGQGSLTGTFSTPLIGGVVQGTTYYINTFTTNGFTVSATNGGGLFTLTNGSGSMNVGMVGWDHVIPGTPPAAVLDSTSVYYIEPKTTYTDPAFSQTGAGNVILLSPGNTWSYMAYNEQSTKWLAVANQGTTAQTSTDGVTWAQTTLPITSGWGGVAYGAGYFVIIPNGGATTALYSNSNGASWKKSTMPSSAAWSEVAYGNGRFVAIAGTTNSAAYSTTYGSTWTSATLPSSQAWTSLAYGNGKFVAISTGGNTITPTAATGSAGTVTLTFNLQSSAPFVVGQSIVVSGMTPAGYNGTYTVTYCDTTTVQYSNPTTVAGSGFGSIVGNSVTAYSADGATWTTGSLPAQSLWSSVAFGNNRFVAVATTAAKSAYSFDGITWYQSNLSIAADNIAYGQGAFLAIGSTSGQAWLSDSGLDWTLQSITNSSWLSICFGFNATGSGIFALLAGTNTGSVISAGVRTKGRATVVSGTITGVVEWEPGSGYTTAPTVTFTDPNYTIPAAVQIRTSNGALASPSFVSQGTGYNTSSTAVTVTGNGYSDQYQTGLTIIMNNLSRMPNVGDNLVISGITNQVYKVTSAYAVYGTSAPNLEANVSISPAMTTALSPANGTTVSIRSLYSQCRLTNHDFLNIGYGDFVESNYPGYPAAGYSSVPNNQTVEINYGRVFYSSTDQDGNFKVGNLFGVQQATGIVTLSASQFALSGLNSISLGGIAVGGSSVIISQFSTDGTFVANSDSIIPTQKAIKTYLTSRLSQGGANTFTGQLTAGTVVVGGANHIKSSVPAGTPGSVVKMTSKVYVSGAAFAGVDGNMASLDFFMRHSFRR